MPLIDQLFIRQVRLLKIKSILRILIITIGISSSASAQSVDEYCLSTVGKIETTNKKTTVFDPTPPLPYFIDSVENFPELYKKPCNKFSRYFWGCGRYLSENQKIVTEDYLTVEIVLIDGHQLSISLAMPEPSACSANG